MTNTLLTDELPALPEQRDQLWAMITDQDLAYKLPGANPTLGELCVEIGFVQQVYIHSFETLTVDWSYRDSTPEQPLNIANLKQWFAALDARLTAALSQCSDEALHSTQIDRGHGFTPSLFVQFQVFREALLIFYAKASVYLKALDKPLTDQWKAWIG